MRLLNIATLFLLCLIFGVYPRVVLAQESFGAWLNALKQEAITAGISEQSVTASINHIQLLPDVIKLDQAQPEFISPFLDYYRRHVDPKKITLGLALLAEHEAVLKQIEAQYGVPKATLIAFWGMETNYGRYQGDIDTLSALATLAYDGRRSAFFRSQLLDAMRMIDAGYANVEQFKGSWAGAFGNMQFMPTTFMTYAVDGDGDKQIDIVNSKADAFASAANYLSQVGWVKGEPVMMEVQLPANFAWQNAQINVRKSVAEWTQLGVTEIHKAAVTTNEKSQLTYSVDDNKPKKLNSSLANLKSSHKKVSHSKVRHASSNNLINKKLVKISAIAYVDKPANASLKISTFPSQNIQAAIVLPQGWRGPAFMVFDNFDAVMDWNRSINYALTVAQLAKSIQGEAPILGGKLAEEGGLSFEKMFTLQAVLNHLGFEAGEPDGFPGIKTQAAIRDYQLFQKIPADGYASHDLLNRLLSD